MLQLNKLHHHCSSLLQHSELSQQKKIGFNQYQNLHQELRRGRNKQHSEKIRIRNQLLSHPIPYGTTTICWLHLRLLLSMEQVNFAFLCLPWLLVVFNTVQSLYLTFLHFFLSNYLPIRLTIAVIQPNEQHGFISIALARHCFSSEAYMLLDWFLSKRMHGYHESNAWLDIWIYKWSGATNQHDLDD